MTQTTLRQLQILHVDDDAINRLVVHEMLSQLGHIPTPAASAQEALDLLTAQAFDVVLADIHMPGMTGLEMVDVMRQPEHPAADTPVVAVTADVMTRSAKAYEQLGFVAAVAKPIMLAPLELALEAATSGGKRPFVADGFTTEGLLR